MADKQIGSLPAATTVDDGSLFVCEQQGVAMKTTGAQWKGFAVEAVRQYVAPAQQAAQQAAASATQAGGYATAAGNSAQQAAESAQKAQEHESGAQTAQEAAETAQGAAEDAKEAIENLSVSAETLEPDQEATVEKTVGPDGAVSLAFGIPQGKTGNVMYATFSIDPETGLLTMTTPDGYSGPVFRLVDGILEVSINA